MLYYLFEFLEKNGEFPGARLFQYISFRSALAMVMSLLISLIFGARIIRSLRNLQVGESVRDLGLKGQKEKEGTPTMGGILIIVALLIPVLLLTKLHNIYIQLLILSTLWMSAIGFLDDYIKVFKKNKQGLAGKFKVVGQIGLGLIVALTMLINDNIVIRVPHTEALEKGLEIVNTFDVVYTSVNEPSSMVKMAYVKSSVTNVPFVKGNNFSYSSLLNFLGDNSDTFLWIIFIPIVIFIVTAVSNASNLTDGIDGLAAGSSAIIVTALGVMAYISGNTVISDYLNVLYIPFTGEMVVFAAAFLGACIGFLWFNTFPAKVFMGDTGSLTLGGIIGAFAILIRKELLIPILCGIFFIETLSVILQVSYFKYTKRKTGEGKRIFLMSPLHHHFQKKGVHEAQIVVRFWIIGVLLAVVTIITFKVR